MLYKIVRLILARVTRTLQNHDFRPLKLCSSLHKFSLFLSHSVNFRQKLLKKIKNERLKIIISLFPFLYQSVRLSFFFFSFLFLSPSFGIKYKPITDTKTRKIQLNLVKLYLATVFSLPSLLPRATQQFTKEKERKREREKASEKDRNKSKRRINQKDFSSKPFSLCARIFFQFSFLLTFFLWLIVSIEFTFGRN